MADALGTVLALMTRVLGRVFAGDSWATWRAVLAAAFALPLTDDERATVLELTSRQVLPSRPVRELWLLLGRRSGKSIVAALIAVWATCCRSYQLVAGEVGVFIVVASDRKQARVIKRYIGGLLRTVPVLERLIDHETSDAIWLTNGLCIEIHTCNFRSLRGYTCIGACCDEVSFWTDEDSSSPDVEVLTALRAAMASVPEALLVATTTLYAKRGEVGRVWDRYHGRDEAEGVLVINAPTLTMNPTIDPAVVQAAYDDDPVAAASEFGGLFRRDVESLFTKDAIAAVTIQGRVQLPPMAGLRYHASVDPAGGSAGGSADSFTASVAHLDETGCCVLDLVVERRPPFSPADTVAEIVSALRPYGITFVVGDKWAGEFPREAFRDNGIAYVPSARPKSDLYRDLVPLVNSQQVELLDVPRLGAQLMGLERKIARGGKDSIDHSPGWKSHDDVCNAAAIALLEARAGGGGAVGVGHAVTADWPEMARTFEEAEVLLARRHAATGETVTTAQQALNKFHNERVGPIGRVWRTVAFEDDTDGRALHDFDPWT